MLRKICFFKARLSLRPLKSECPSRSFMGLEWVHTVFPGTTNNFAEGWYSTQLANTPNAFGSTEIVGSSMRKLSKARSSSARTRSTSIAATKPNRSMQVEVIHFT